MDYVAVIFYSITLSFVRIKVRIVDRSAPIHNDCLPPFFSTHKKKWNKFYEMNAVAWFFSSYALQGLFLAPL